ncbi:fatty acid cis/trans isomerase [Zobellella aerophila]|uniref:Fatty acid cis/trans isomerase n=1 Tax=Zobellella aerophila TaxID=870480 RepID=A0ABP6V2D4_9GAMM
MNKRIWFAVLPALLAGGAMLALYRSAPQEELPRPTPASPQPVDYLTDIRPIFEHKCVVCHACYDAPCQLKLSSHQGVVRGASKQRVYDGTRTQDAEPNRLHVDAHDEQAWRGRGFYSVIDGNGPLPALMERMLALGHDSPWPANERLPDRLDIAITRSNRCTTADEFDDYARKHPYGGMPFAVTGLSEAEYQTLLSWLGQGAPVPEQQTVLSDAMSQTLNQWEAWLNRPEPRRQLVSRYLYEHWFLAHLSLTDHPEPVFFELLRSRTPPGEPIAVLATVRPTDGITGAIYYRLRPRLETRVHKTHITYPLSREKMARLEQLFFSPDWAVSQLPDYSPASAANPFVTFAAIPARARYQYLLDNALYFTRTFIRGPVCRGQIATDVIRDQFWVGFQSPDHDLFVTYPAHAAAVGGWLALPGLTSDLLSLGPDWISHRDQRNRYLARRQRDYARQYPEGPDLEHLWHGDRHNPDALLTIFRHHDSASVIRGWQGATPSTMWIMDYPLLERTYYALVANFNVYGSVSHQAQTRLYFDLIRNGSETNLLRFLPPALRNELLHSWYDQSGKLKLFTTYADVDEQTPSRLRVSARVPLADFGSQVLRQLAEVRGPEDTLNRCPDGDCRRVGSSAAEQQAERSLRALTGVTAGELPAIQWLPEVSLLRVEVGERRLVYSLLHNRDHSNVAFILGEDLRLRPQNDTLTILPGIVGSYPNFIFNIKLEQLDDFVAALQAMAREADLNTLARHFGIRRTHPQFWFYLHDMHAYMQESSPQEAGLLDINRYLNL